METPTPILPPPFAPPPGSAPVGPTMAQPPAQALAQVPAQLAVLTPANSQQDPVYVVIATSAIEETWCRGNVPTNIYGGWAVDIYPHPGDTSPEAIAQAAERAAYLAQLDSGDRHAPGGPRYSKLVDGTWRIVLSDQRIAMIRQASIDQRCRQETWQDVTCKIHPLKTSADVALDLTRAGAAGAVPGYAGTPAMATLRLAPGEELGVATIKDDSGRVVELHLRVQARPKADDGHGR